MPELSQDALQRTMYKDVFELAPVAFALVDSADRIVSVNPALVDWIGRDPAQLVGKEWTSTLLTVAGRVFVETHLRPLLRMQHAARGIAVDLRTADGRRLPVVATLVARRSDRGSGYLLTFLEAIDREHYERELMHAKHAAEDAADQLRELADDLEHRVAIRTAELERANRELDSFAHAVSHDLRAPLRSISGFNGMLLEDYGHALDANGRKILSSVDSATRAMSDLIDGLLQLSLMTRGEMSLQRCDLSQMAEAIREELASGEPNRSVEWRIEPGLTAMADPRMLQAVLRNLLGNAWKYTSKTANARIMFDSRTENGERIFRVADNGVGFDRHRAHRLFEPFQRMHSQSEFAGLGLGLATVQRIVCRHGGRLAAESKPNVGAVFEFTLASASQSVATEEPRRGTGASS